VTSPREPAIVLLAHGSPDPRHAVGVGQLAATVRRLAPRRPVLTAYLDHHPPSPTDAAAQVDGDASVVPVLLTPAYHARVDVPAALAAMNEVATGRLQAVDPLGPDPLLLEGAVELLVAAGIAADPATGVVLYAAGSSDSAAAASVVETVRQNPVPGWGPWTVAALDGGATLGDALGAMPPGTRRAVAVSFMVAEGVLRDRMAAACAEAGITMVEGALGQTEALARLVLRRADTLPA
jgi:sirohydrochlorin ferrochelatase